MATVENTIPVPPDAGKSDTFDDDVQLIVKAMFDVTTRHEPVRAALKRTGMDGPILNLAALQAVLDAARLHPECPPVPSDDDEPVSTSPDFTLFYVQCATEIVGNCILWWGTNHNGYTTELHKAGKYTSAACRTMRDTDIPWPVEYIDAHTTMHVRADTDATAGGKRHPIAAAAFLATRRSL